MRDSGKVRIRDHKFEPCPTFGDAYCVHVSFNGRTCTWQERKHVGTWWSRLVRKPLRTLR